MKSLTCTERPFGRHGTDQGLEGRVGAADRARLGRYFTTLRHLELPFDQQLRPPEPIAARVAPKPIPEDLPPGRERTLVAERHRTMKELMVLAVACD